MSLKDWMNYLLDLTVVFSFDRSGYKRHCPEPLQKVDLSGLHGIVTGGGSGIGLATGKSLLQQGMQCEFIGRTLEKLENSYQGESLAAYQSLDLADLNQVFAFTQEVKGPIDLLIHNAGSMPLTLSVTEDGFEEMFATQVLAPFIMTKRLAELGKLRSGSRVIFVSSGGMYLKKLDLSDLLFEKNEYDKYAGYANAKRAQVILAELFAKKYPEYLFSSMHPGWADTPGVRYSMPSFQKTMENRLRTPEEGADTILWLATTPDYPNGKFWFDRKQAKTTILNFYASNEAEKESLWQYCESIYSAIKGRSQ
jgi:dehydrogenase/reductase SDR family protein 12